MNYIFKTGVIGSLALITGASWPEPKNTDHPKKSIKNWLFADQWTDYVNLRNSGIQPNQTTYTPRNNHEL